VTRVLALDHGSSLCGVAVSDPSGTIATPLDPVRTPSSKAGLGQLESLCNERAVERVIVGLPLSLAGAETAQTEEARKFADRLRQRLSGVPIELVDERLTTAEANSRGGDAAEDSRAAAVLLERWLEINGGSEL